MPYIPGKGWTSVVTGQPQVIPMDDIAMSGTYAATPAQQMVIRPSALSPVPGGSIWDQPGVKQAGLPAIAPVIGAAAGALGLATPAWLTAILGAGAAAVGGAQALGYGEGGGIFGVNLFGGDEFTMGGVEFGGPGLPEPTQPYTEWHSGNKQFYHMSQYTAAGKYAGAKVAMYNKDTGKWKVWNLPKPHLAVIGKNMPRHQMLTRLRRNLKRHTSDAKTILKLTQPSALESHRRPGGRYVPGKKRYID